MLYRLQECRSRIRSSQPPSDVILYRGMTKSKAEHDITENRLHFSRAIIHDNDTQESEMFKTREEKNRELEQLGFGSESIFPEDQTSKEFFECADKLYSAPTTSNVVRPV